MSGADPVAAAAARHRLARRLSRAITELEDPHAPMVVVDLDAFDANAHELTRRTSGKPVRLATKSVRIPALISRALDRDGFGGVLSYALREALWLVEEEITTDVVMGYPSVDAGALRRLAAQERFAARITLMVDDSEHLDLIDSCRDGAPLRVAVDVDAGLRMPGLHVGPKRSPLHEVAQVLALVRDARRRGLHVEGVMTYEGQVAGVPDDVPGQRARSLILRRLKAASIHQLVERRAAVAAALADEVELRFWNAGGSGSIEASAADPTVTEVSAGSGLLAPGLFDHYRSFRPRPAAFFGVPVVRRPRADMVTVAGGGYVASGPVGPDRAPLPWAPPGLELTGLEGAGEVQTPLTGPGTAGLRVGDWVWFRHAKAGELAEHAGTVHLVRGDRVVASVPSYRGLGHAW